MIFQVRKSRRFGIICAVKKTIILFVLCGTVALTGCFSLETAPLGGFDGAQGASLQSNYGKAAEHVVVSNFGWYFFNRWPIVCGNARPDRKSAWVFFRDDVDEHLLQRRLMQYASERGCDATDVHLFNNAEVLMSIGVGGVSLPLPYVVSYRELQYSCSLVAKSAPAAAEPASGKGAGGINEEMRRLLDSIPDGGGQ